MIFFTPEQVANALLLLTNNDNERTLKLKKITLELCESVTATAQYRSSKCQTSRLEMNRGNYMMTWRIPKDMCVSCYSRLYWLKTSSCNVFIETGIMEVLV